MLLHLQLTGVHTRHTITKWGGCLVNTKNHRDIQDGLAIIGHTQPTFWLFEIISKLLTHPSLPGSMSQPRAFRNYLQVFLFVPPPPPTSSVLTTLSVSFPPSEIPYFPIIHHLLSVPLPPSEVSYSHITLSPCLQLNQHHAS